MRFALLWTIGASIVSAMKRQRSLVHENLALRQQVIMLKRSVKRATPTNSDRFFWIVFTREVTGWRKLLFALNPDTVVGWHREGFRRYWTWKCRRVGRPQIAPELRHIIQRMQTENLTWGAPRIHGALIKLGYAVSEATVSKYMKRIPKPPSQSWRTFLNNHREAIAAIDLFTVPTATFRILYIFVVIEHARRQTLHFNVTEHPTARWTAQQLTEAFPFDSPPRYLLRDGDAIYGDLVRAVSPPWVSKSSSLRRLLLGRSLMLSG